MSGPPPPPQVSPDGKFYWDGQRWVPMPGQASSQPAPMAQQRQPQLPTGYEIKKKGHFWRNGAIGCGGIIALIIFIPWCSGLTGHPISSSSPGTSSPAASSAPATHTVLLDKTGSGINKTPNFTTAGAWEIDWSYDCSSFGQSGNFAIIVYNADGSMNDLAANQLGAKGTDVANEHQGGTYYLEMDSECDWHVIVKG